MILLAGYEWKRTNGFAFQTYAGNSFVYFTGFESAKGLAFIISLIKLNARTGF
jgi:hypothetical protein